MTAEILATSVDPSVSEAAACGGQKNVEGRDRRNASWYWSKEEIDHHSPSRRDGIDLRKETFLRKSYCTFCQDFGMRLKVPQLTIATAIVLCHRFFLRQSHAKNDRFTIATICMFLAGKVEETPRALNKVIMTSYEIRFKKDPEAVQRIRQKELYEEQKEVILIGEQLVLTTLGFDLNIAHPYKPLVSALKKFSKVKTQTALTQVAWNFVNDGLRTSLCLQFKPHHIAAGAIFLAARFLKVKLPSDGDNAWWREFDVTPAQLEEVSSQMLELYEQNKAGAASSTSASARGSKKAGPGPSALRKGDVSSASGLPAIPFGKEKSVLGRANPERTEVLVACTAAGEMPAPLRGLGVGDPTPLAGASSGAVSMEEIHEQKGTDGAEKSWKASAAPLPGGGKSVRSSREEQKLTEASTLTEQADAAAVFEGAEQDTEMDISPVEAPVGVWGKKGSSKAQTTGSEEDGGIEHVANPEPQKIELSLDGNINQQAQLEVEECERQGHAVNADFQGSLVKQEGRIRAGIQTHMSPESDVAPMSEGAVDIKRKRSDRDRQAYEKRRKSDEYGHCCDDMRSGGEVPGEDDENQSHGDPVKLHTMSKPRSVEEEGPSARAGYDQHRRYRQNGGSLAH